MTAFSYRKNSFMNNFEIGGLSEQDTIATKQLDSMSGFGLAPWVADTGPEDNLCG